MEDAPSAPCATPGCLNPGVLPRNNNGKQWCNKSRPCIRAYEKARDNHELVGRMVPRNRKSGKKRARASASDRGGDDDTDSLADLMTSAGNEVCEKVFDFYGIRCARPTRPSVPTRP